MPTVLRKSYWIQFAISASESKTNRQNKIKQKKNLKISWRLQAMQGHKHAKWMNPEQSEHSNLKLLSVKLILKRQSSQLSRGVCIFAFLCKILPLIRSLYF